MNDRIVRAGKFMSLVLRHRPDKIGLTLDANGWAKVSDLVACSRNGNVRLSLDLILEVVATNDKKRFVLKAHNYIRRRVTRPPSPFGLRPTSLYTGTVTFIRQSGP